MTEEQDTLTEMLATGEIELASKEEEVHEVFSGFFESPTQEKIDEDENEDVPKLVHEDEDEELMHEVQIEALILLSNRDFRLGLAAGGETREFLEENFLIGLDDDEMKVLQKKADEIIKKRFSF